MLKKLGRHLQRVTSDRGLRNSSSFYISFMHEYEPRFEVLVMNFQPCFLFHDHVPLYNYFFNVALLCQMPDVLCVIFVIVNFLKHYTYLLTLISCLH